MHVDLRPHQHDALERLDNGKILYGGVGTGKSRVAAAYYATRETPRDVVVITTAKKRDSMDWVGEFAAFGVGRTADSTLHGILTVDSWNNIENYIDRTDTFFIFDEQRLVGSGAWTKAFIKIAKRNRWILLSATPGDTWLDYIPVFIANGFYKNRTEFLREHVVYSNYSKFPKVDRYLSPGLLVKHRNSLLVEMPFLRTTVRHTREVVVPHDDDRLAQVVKKRWHVFEERPLKNVAELFYIMRKVVNSDPSRVEQIRILAQEHPRLIVFYNFDYELELLRELQWDYNVAEWNGHKHQAIPVADSWIYLVQYVSGSEGWNCVSTDAMVFYSLTYSYKNWHQAFGRIDRLNTLYTELYYYVLISNSWIDGAVWKSLQSKKSFNEAKYADTKALKG